jgi:hypothetical protein
LSGGQPPPLACFFVRVVGKWGESELIILINKNMGIDTIPQAPQDDKKDVPVAEAKAEGRKLEWGKAFDSKTSYVMHGWIEDVNRESKILEPGKKPWKLPTVDELVSEFKKTGSRPDGFNGGIYWSSDGNYNEVFGVDMDDGSTGWVMSRGNDSQGQWRLVRDAA